MSQKTAKDSEEQEKQEDKDTQDSQKESQNGKSQDDQETKVEEGEKGEKKARGGEQESEEGKEKSEVEALKEELEEYKEKAEEAEEKYLRVLAEFNNYKKKAKKDREKFAQLANKDLMMELLPVLDDMERGQQSIEEAEDVDSVKEGLEFIFQKLKKALEEKGLQDMESEGEDFDPDYHEAVSNMEVEDEEQKGKVIEEVQKGYLLNDRIIRHAKVVVGE